MATFSETEQAQLEHAWACLADEGGSLEGTQKQWTELQGPACAGTSSQAQALESCLWNGRQMEILRPGQMQGRWLWAMSPVDLHPQARSPTSCQDCTWHWSTLTIRFSSTLACSRRVLWVPKSPGRECLHMAMTPMPQEVQHLSRSCTAAVPSLSRCCPTLTNSLHPEDAAGPNGKDMHR